MGEPGDAYAVDIQIDDVFLDDINPDVVHTAAVATLQALRIKRASLNVVITDDAAVHELNRQYRGIDAPTDVLSFAAQESADEAPALTLPPELDAEFADFLGDVIIALPYAKQQAARYANPLDAEVRLLVVHGVLHLLGYDHATPEEETIMWSAQDAVLAAFGEQTHPARTHAD